jgi:NADH-quinone oxidoreductase subunit N
MLPFLSRVVTTLFSADFSVLFLFILLSGFSSVCFASIGALYQKRLKRLLAYSTVSHTGFMLLGLACLTPDAIKSCSIYIILYSIMTLCLFCIIFLSNLKHYQQKYIINWVSVFERNPFVAVVLSVVLFSIGGVPPFAGFYSKLCIFLSLLSKQQVCILLLLAVFSAISCFYYIKLIKVLFFNTGIRSFF